MTKTKYQLISDEIRSKILSNAYPKGSTIPSETQLQKEYDVSRHTVRQAIALLVNEGYLRKEKGAGTFVDDRYLSPSLEQKKQQKTIGVITTYVSDYIFPSIIRGIEQELRKDGYSLLLASTNNDLEQEAACLEQMLNQGVSGLIVEPTKSNTYNPNLSYYLSFKERGIPVVMINANYEELSLPTVCVDDTQAGFLATDYLLNHGHNHLGLLIKLDDLQGKYRMKGFIKAHEEWGKPFKGNYIWTYTTETKDIVIKQMLEELDQSEVTGLVCYNDEVAQVVMQELLAAGKRIPDDYSIIGNDDSFLSSSNGIQLTTLSHPKEALGETAAKKIIAASNGEKIDNKVFQPQLIIRDSVKK